jgi:hypothetical protein
MKLTNEAVAVKNKNANDIGLNIRNEILYPVGIYCTWFHMAGFRVCWNNVQSFKFWQHQRFLSEELNSETLELNA